jgi:hypothetical protein
MRVARLEDLPEILRTEGQRPGTFRSRHLAEGEPGTPGNFSLVMGTNTDGRTSPRHRHNFEQIRYQLEGSEDYDRDGKLEKGMVGYYPEGTYYGPQTGGGNTTMLLLQFGGPSGAGYMSRAALKAGYEEMKKLGTFRDGIFRPHADQAGLRNRDGYEAVWEHVNGRPISYAKPRYERPVLMHPGNFDWEPLEGVTGGAIKTLGVFTEKRTEIHFVRLEPGARWRIRGRRLCFVIEGSGRVAGENYLRHTTVHSESGEQAEVTATSPTEILDIGLPEFGTVRSAARAA